MTTSKMESPLWNKLRNDNTPLSMQQQQQLQQQQQQQKTSFDLNNEHQNLNNLTSTINLLNLNSIMYNNNNNSSVESTATTNSDYTAMLNGSGVQNGALKYSHLPLNSISTNKLVKREIGCIEKMLVSYGFVKCIDRDGRYFFHYSSYQGDPSSLKIGDLVEFEESVDKRNGKPIAINLTKPSAFSSPVKQSFFDLQQQQPQLNLASNNENFNNLLASLAANSSHGASFKQQKSFTMSGTALNNQNLIQALINNSTATNNAAAASNTTSSSSSSGSGEIVGDQMFGSIAIPSKKDCIINGVISIPDGRITYEKNGETFYIPYARNDIVNATTENVKFGDKVTFFMVQNIASGVIYARKIELLRNKSPARGLVTSCKETFGRIEREDGGKEIFFHFADLMGGNLDELCVGASVEFEVENRHGKEIASNIKLLPMGTVSFDEVSKVSYIGRILKPASAKEGRIIYDCNEEKLVELIFYERDRIGEFTLFEGDIVQFKVATDKRTKFRRAIDVLLIEQLNTNGSSSAGGNNKEKRENGVIDKLFEQQQNKYGAIRSVERDELVYFCCNEFISLSKILQVGDCVDFAVIECPKDAVFKTGLKAIRIKSLPENSVKFETVSTETFVGYIEKDAVEVKIKSQDKLNANRRSENSLAVQDAKTAVATSSTTAHGLQSIASSPAFSTLIQQQQQKNEEKDVKYEAGLIKYEVNGETKQIQYFTYNIISMQKNNRIQLHYLDRVEFNIHTVIKDKKRTAVNLKLIEKHIEQGYIAVLKENYGFIEMVSQPKDLFFHYSSTISSLQEIDIGDEVEFFIRKNGTKMNAENVVKLTQGTIQTHNLVPFLYKGRILQPTRFVNHEQDDFFGKVQVFDDNQNGDVYQFGVSGLFDKKMLLLAGDLVNFQVGISPDGNKKAFNITKNSKDANKGKVESIKGQYGFIDFPIGDAKKLLFYLTDIENVAQSELKPGDEVEFNVSYNNRNGKYYANKVKKLNISTASTANAEQPKRPERLITRLKTTNIDDKSGKQLTLVRQPRNPDMKMKSFSRQRIDRMPGQLPLDQVESTTTATTTTTPAVKNASDETTKISHFNNLIAQQQQ